MQEPLCKSPKARSPLGGSRAGRWWVLGGSQEREQQQQVELLVSCEGASATACPREPVRESLSVRVRSQGLWPTSDPKAFGYGRLRKGALANRALANRLSRTRSHGQALVDAPLRLTSNSTCCCCSRSPATHPRPIRRGSRGGALERLLQKGIKAPMPPEAHPQIYPKYLSIYI